MAWLDYWHTVTLNVYCLIVSLSMVTLSTPGHHHSISSPLFLTITSGGDQYCLNIFVSTLTLPSSILPIIFTHGTYISNMSVVWWTNYLQQKIARCVEPSQNWFCFCWLNWFYSILFMHILHSKLLPYLYSSLALDIEWSTARTFSTSSSLVVEEVLVWNLIQKKWQWRRMVSLVEPSCLCLEN